MSKRGRKSYYETLIEPNLKEIGELVKKGLLQREIMEILGVKKTAWYKAKVEHAEFAEVLSNKHRLEAIEQLEAAALRTACGYEYTEVKKVYKAPDPELGLDTPTLATMEVTEKHQPANARLNMYLLQNWGKEYGYTADPVQQELRRDELEFRKAQKAPPEWDDDVGGV